ncbi:restriction endonuclease subunit S [Pontibacter sp. 172403-2]|uniref:restriction endonuclease subunit S n=1 Tax=Pontibacter rufus TaxID=2791028 RepID=UPI0018AF6D9F|nr:restriction endonuclease subunit S [Pontibacter sp. 172403-2]MBF9254231.1 restriction endonuclease subunit S [Pontibacter sp. 172403-2]
MSKWRKMLVGDFIKFNPIEKMAKSTIAKKIAMEKLTANERKITGYELSGYNGGAKFRNGDTLFAKITPCLENGKTAQVDILDDAEVGFGSTEFIVLRENESSSNDFIYYLAKSPVFRKKAISCMEGTSGRKRVNEGALMLQEIRVPDLPTQNKIAAVLSSLDAKIELNNRINDELEAMAKTLYDYWFVQFDFPDASGKPYKTSGGKMEWNEELKREVPEGWKVGTLSDLGNIVGGSTPSTAEPENFTTDGTPWITPKDLSLNVGKKYITKGETDVTDKGIKSASLKLLPKGTILMSSRAPIGYMAIAREEVTTNQGFKSFVPKEGYSTEFVFLTVERTMPAIASKASGSTFKEVSGGVVKAIEIVLPPKPIIKAFTSVVEPIFKKQDILELQNKQLSELRDWLLPMLMNGQVTVAEAEESLAMAAEPEEIYSIRRNGLNIPENKKAFAKQVLGGKIVSLFKDDPHFTHIKFQKLQYLAEHIAEADLNLNYYFQAAGPYDNKFMHSISNKLKSTKWFEEKAYKFIPLENQLQIEGYFKRYFSPVAERLSKLFSLLADKSEAETEIMATLYAVWNNRIIKQQPISDKELIEDFYNWSNRKHQYTQQQILQSLQIIRSNNFMPTGFGKEIKRAKSNSKQSKK